MSTPFAIEIDRIADDFEDAWKGGRQPTPGDYLLQLPEPARPALLIELVRIEVEYRRRTGENASESRCLEQYQAQFGVTADSPRPPPTFDPPGEGVTPPSTGGPFEFQHVLGKGAMGVVWAARDTLLEREVAIKVLNPEHGASSLARLMREARSTAKVNHPNVVQIFQVLPHEGQVFIVMERLGRSLADELKEKGALPWQEATRAVRDVAAGLTAAHAAELVHRDIKPANLLRSSKGEVKVVDFGLVYSSDATVLTSAGAIVGTPLYMSPEQWRGGKADACSDVYSLCCTFYHLLTGHAPFETDSKAELLLKHINGPFPDPRVYVPSLPRSVCDVIATGCSKDPALRYSGAAEVLTELQAILEPTATDRPIPPPATDARLRIFISSPGDVAEERVLANNLVRRLSDEYAQRLWIEPVFWEHEPLLPHDTFQNQVPRPSQSEIVVSILWSRLGTRIPPEICRPDGSRYASGTEYEFEDAVEGRKKNGFPDLLVYRKTAAPLVSLEDDEDLERRRYQKKALDGFIQKWFFDGADRTLQATFRPFENTAKFEKILERDLRKLIQRRIAAGPAVRVAAAVKPSWTKGSPFRGLDVFEMHHAPVFFGRTKAIGDVLNVLRSNAAAGRAFSLILGPSGSGKSSLARAGVLPLLSQPGVIEDVGLWRWAIMRPGDKAGDLFLSLAVALLHPEALPELAADGTTPERLANELRGCPKGAGLLAKGGLSLAVAGGANSDALPEARLALVVDQMEELFTLDKVSPAARVNFVDALSSFARSNRVFVIGTLRSDFYDRCGDLPELIALKEGNGQYDLLAPTPSEIGQMIRQPAFAAGLRFEEDERTGVRLDDVLRDAAAQHPESLPLLEFALERLFQEKDELRGLLLLSAYTAMGGVEGALNNQAENSFREAGALAQGAFPRVFRKLVTLSVENDHPPVRLRALRSETDTDAGSRELVDRLIADRLLVADSTEDVHGTRQTVVSLAHEAILRCWPRLQAWIASEGDNLKSHAEVGADARRWNEKDRSPDYLYSGGLPLDRAKALLELEFLNANECDFVVASLRKVAAFELEQSVANARDMQSTARRVRIEYPDLYANVLRRSAESEDPRFRENVAILLGAEPPCELSQLLVGLVVSDQKDSVRRAAAASLIRLDRPELFDRVVETLREADGSNGVRALVNLRVAADAVEAPTALEPRMCDLKPSLKSLIRVQARFLRLRRGWPIILIAPIPAVLISSFLSALFKMIPGAFNYAYCQANASAPSGAFHAVVAVVLWGGVITFCITVHRVVIRTQHGKKSTLQPWSALVAGAIGGAVSSCLILLVITLVCDTQGTIALGWTNTDWHTDWSHYWNDIFWRTRSFWPYMIMGIGLGVGMAAMSNTLWTAKHWSFLTASRPLMTGKELLPTIKTITRSVLRFAWPIPVFMLVADLFALWVIRTAPITAGAPAWMNGWHARLLGGMSHDAARVREWKMSIWGQGLGIFFDSATQAWGGFFCIVGLVLGFIVIQYGIKIEARKN